jgi:hypothetical protein
MTTDRPREYLQLDGFVNYPREDLDAEYKEWLNWKTEMNKAIIAKAAIALSNHGGGYLMLGFKEKAQILESLPRPCDIPEITQDDVNGIIRRYAEPEFHCEVHYVSHQTTQVSHTVIRVPPSDVPVRCRRDQVEAAVSQNRFYIRKPGPRSEEPQTAEEWRGLLDRCVRARREDMLDAIRSIFWGQTETLDPSTDPVDALAEFCAAAHDRWTELVSDRPSDSPARFPHGYYELAFALVGATPAESMNQLMERLGTTQGVKLSGWTPFLHMQVPGWQPYAYEDFIEAWVGRPVEGQMWDDAFHADFWRASLEGKLYTIRGYIEDSELAQQRRSAPGTEFSNAIPSIKIAEGLLFARRLATLFEDVEQIAIRCRFTGLKGRSLLLVDHPIPFTEVGPVAQDSEVILKGQVSLQQVDDNLPEVVHSLVGPLYERFGFYQISIDHIQRMLKKLRRFN